MLFASKNKEPAEWAELYTSSNQYSVLMNQIYAERESPDPVNKLSSETALATIIR